MHAAAGNLIEDYTAYCKNSQSHRSEDNRRLGKMQYSALQSHTNTMSNFFSTLCTLLKTISSLWPVNITISSAISQNIDRVILSIAVRSTEMSKQWQLPL